MQDSSRLSAFVFLALYGLFISCTARNQGPPIDLVEKSVLEGAAATQQSFITKPRQPLSTFIQPVKATVVSRSVDSPTTAEAEVDVNLEFKLIRPVPKEPFMSDEEPVLIYLGRAAITGQVGQSYTRTVKTFWKKFDTGWRWERVEPFSSVL